ncbi:TIR domain-containing protein [Terrimonas rubra]|uniref:TIR domain-containing protein n=1 Tax=Terrimonas rubra TaxID=1035890 RepID=A0ABW6A1I2_9BACT
MAKRQIFYSFHYDNDVFRVQQIRNIGALEENQPVSINDWEKVKQGGPRAIEQWIDSNLKGKSCLIVLIGTETYSRPWVKYEIEKAWRDGKGVLGVYIHNINCMKNGRCNQGLNPFEYTYTPGGVKLSGLVRTYNPAAGNAYSNIADNLEQWVETAINDR